MVETAPHPKGLQADEVLQRGGELDLSSQVCWESTPSATGEAAVSESEGDLATQLHAPLPPGLTAPDGWKVSTTGLACWNARVRQASWRWVSGAPLLITRRLLDSSTQEEWLALTWLRHGHWHHRVVPRVQLMDSRVLIRLAAYGAPVDSDNAREWVRFLRDFERHNLTMLPVSTLFSRCGWVSLPKGLGFLVGRTWITAQAQSTVSSCGEKVEGACWHPEAGMAELMGLQPRGEWNEWCRAWGIVLPYPRVVLGVYASLAASLLTWIPEAPNLIVDWCGETSGGKTTTLRLAASVWGAPDPRMGGLIHSWDLTPAYLERLAARVCGLPLILDDSQRARHPEALAAAVYQLSSGQGRGRARVEGMQPTTWWRTVVLSTGETPLTALAEAGGTHARVLTLWGTPFGRTSTSTAREVSQLQSLLGQHHGHVGPRFVQALLKASSKPDLRQAYRTVLLEWERRGEGHPVAHRAAAGLALLQLARDLLHRWLRLPRPAIDPLQEAWKAVQVNHQAADRASEALREVLAWAHSFADHFDRGPGDPRFQPSTGWLGLWQPGAEWSELCIFGHRLRSVLRREGFEPTAILKTWRDRGWIDCDSDSFTRNRTLRGRRVRCVVIRRHTTESTLGG